MNTEPIDLFDDQQKAIDHALWLNFKYRIAKIKFGVIHGPDNNWAVLEEATAVEMETAFLNVLPESYEEMTYKDLYHLKMDQNPLPHWEKIMGLFSTTDGEILRYLIDSKVPLEKMIRHELALRGYDENHRWAGFEKAAKIWLK